jgi:nucleoside-diphosphate-sugar epimerase
MASEPASVFVTGASGFIGRHVVRLLDQRGYRVRALVRRIPSRPFDENVEVVIGDLTKPETYWDKLNGALAVVHSALTENFSGDLEATASLQDLSARAGVRKFIHMSSIAVYGNPPSGNITEETSCHAAADTYSRTKLAIEEALRRDSKIPELVILRLGCVYGPGGGWWSDGLLNMMKSGKLIVVNGGTGTANLIHVADIAGMVELLLKRSNSEVEVFNVTDGVPVPWSRYFSGLEEILGRSATASMGAGEAREYGRKWLQPSLPRRVIRKLLGARRIHPLDDKGIDGFTSTAVYSNQKAVQTLDFRPQFDLEKGMQTVRDT